MNYAHDACGSWTFPPPGLRGETFSAAGAGSTTGGSITLPATATRVGDRCASRSEDGGGFRCDVEPDQQGACRDRDGPVFVDADPAGTFADTPQEPGTLARAEQGQLPTTDVDALVAV